MDPLSVTASVIALVQGTSAVTKGFKAVVDLRKAPEEYQELVGEIAWLQAYLGRLHSNFERAECAQQFNETDLSPLNSALRRVERTVSDLQSATNIVQKDSKGVENSRRVSKLKWQIHSSKITQLRDQVQQRRKDLHDAIGLLHFQNGIQNQILLRASVASTRPSSPDLQDGNIDEQEILSDTNEQASEYSIDSLFSRRCPKICRCKCHHRPDWHAPSWLSRKLHESMSYLLGMHYWKMSLCDDPVCRDVSQQRVTMLCQIPFYHRALSIRLMWNSTSSHEASIHLRVPRLVDSTSYTWHAIRYGSLRSLQLLLDTKKAYPNDTREDGLNLLLSAVALGRTDMTEYLLTIGADIFHEDITGRSAIALLTSYTTYTSGALRLAACKILRDITTKSETGHVPTIHKLALNDALLNNDHCEARRILEIDPSRANERDGIGHTPLDLSICFSDAQMVELLLLYGADQAQINERKDNSPLVAATRLEMYQSLQLLLESCPDRLVREEFYYAVRCGSSRSVSMFLATGAITRDCLTSVFNVHFVRRQPNDPEDNQDAEDILRQLVQHGLGLEDVRGGVAGALCTAVWVDNPTTVAAILTVFGKPDVPEQYNQRFLHYAGYWATLDTINVLREAGLEGIDPDEVDRYGWTPEERMSWRETCPEVDLIINRTSRPTSEDSEAFKLLLQEIRDRNEENGVWFDSSDDEEYENDDEDIDPPIPGAWTE